VQEGKKVPVDLVATLHPLGVPFHDPTLRVTAREAVRATRTPEGPATIHLAVSDAGTLALRGWGPGRDWALDVAAAWDANPAVELPAPAPKLRVPGRATPLHAVRLVRTRRVFELLVAIVLEQLVSGAEASRSFSKLVRRFSEPAPGPFADLWLPLGPEQIRAIPLAAFPACGALPKQGATLHELARRATRVEEAAAMDADAAERRLRAFPGVGVWTARSAMLRGMGFPDAVPLGDYHLPSVVAWNLAGEERADDARMLALLEPWRGQRGRVVRWIGSAGSMPPRRGPRAPMRPLDPSPRLGAR
jgi:3-methyladenine DNA glycosylase/8-oxoguanine DNA glycosylase